ncbi:hypothetical protein GCM10011339_33900 [Echinicola rosea]|uniref:Uncharacterized protein n=2 Tax=Echinicola rosea TaxID=1807691 RepID=A0ABQ1V967_9BACT|nr:hypothetical protein GCM10011339_33900 [Echinicola rosea]
MPVLKAKGYDGAYHCKAAYPGKFTSSIRGYINAFIKGKEDYPANGLTMSTYLQWKGEGSDYTMARLKLDADGMDKWKLSCMEISHRDRFGRIIQERKLSPKDIQDIPSRKLAIKMVNPVVQQKSRRYGI